MLRLSNLLECGAKMGKKKKGLMTYLQPAILIAGVTWLVRKFKKGQVHVDPD